MVWKEKLPIAQDVIRHEYPPWAHYPATIWPFTERPYPHKPILLYWPVPPSAELFIHSPRSSQIVNPACPGPRSHSTLYISTHPPADVGFGPLEFSFSWQWRNPSHAKKSWASSWCWELAGTEDIPALDPNEDGRNAKFDIWEAKYGDSRLCILKDEWVIGDW